MGLGIPFESMGLTSKVESKHCLILGDGGRTAGIREEVFVVRVFRTLLEL